MLLATAHARVQPFVAVPFANGREKRHLPQRQGCIVRASDAPKEAATNTSSAPAPQASPQSNATAPERELSVKEALKAAQQRQAAAQQGGKGGKRQADSTDWIASGLTRRFGIAGGLAWLGFLTFGAVSEQIKTRLEVASEENNTKVVNQAKVVVLPSGVTYTDLVVGGGQRPQRGDLVAAQLRIEVEGQVLLDTAARNRPLAFLYGSRPTGGVTKGLEEAMATMQAGGKRTMVVPPAQAYGDEGAVLTPNPKKPDDVVRIPPGAELVYTVELLRVSIAPS